MDGMTKSDDILDLARKRFDEAASVEKVNHERGSQDIAFATGEGQWLESERQAREAEGKPTLTFNRMSQFVRQVTGQIRRLNPAIKVSAASGDASKEVAEVIEGLVREIEYRCDAPTIYEGAAESAAQCGIGNFRILHEYCSWNDFSQHIVIQRIHNPFAVFYDPRAKDATRKDAQFCFVIEELPPDEFKAQYPKANPIEFTGEHRPAWVQNWTRPEGVVVAEYYWIEREEVEIFQLPDGSVVEAKQIPEGWEGRDALPKRKTQRPRVMWAKMTGAEILEGPKAVAGDYIPVVAVTGEEIHNGEEVYRSGVIRHAKDAQIVYNVAQTTAVEVALLQPRAPYLVTPRHIAGFETYWADANQANRPYLPYNPDPNAGMPSRVQPPIPSSALQALAVNAAEDMKATTGIYDASLGARSNETSGVAIKARQMESEIGSSIYADNMVKSVAHAGRIIVSMIPQIYDTQRAVAILGEDGQEKLVTLNRMFIRDGVAYSENDMTSGKYTTRVSVGPTYASRKAESSANMLEFLRTIPQAAPMISDLIAAAQEWPGADRIAGRLKRAVPQQLLEGDEQEGNADPQQQAMQQQMAMQQQQMQQAAQQIEMRKAAAEVAEAEAKARKAEADAQKAQIEAAIMQLSMQNAGQPALVPGPPPVQMGPFGPA
jgi:hypothetical protein